MKTDFIKLSQASKNEWMENQSRLITELRKVLRWYYTTTRYPDGATLSQTEDLDYGFDVEISELKGTSHYRPTIKYGGREMYVTKLNESRHGCYLTLIDCENYSSVKDISVAWISYESLLEICCQISGYLQCL